MHPALGKSSIGEFTRAEFLAFVDDIVHARGGSEAEDDAWVNHFDHIVAPHPAGTDLLFWPAPGATTPRRASPPRWRSMSAATACRDSVTGDPYLMRRWWRAGARTTIARTKPPSSTQAPK